VTPPETRQHPERQDDHDGADFHHQQIKKRGAAVGGVLVLESHQKIASERHQFPADDEEKGIIGEQHQLHAGHEQTGKGTENGKGMPAAL